MFTEERLVKFFLRIKNEHTTSICVFLSKRFAELYNILKTKYPEIDLPLPTLILDEYEMMGIKTSDIVYLNDTLSELPKRFEKGNKLEVYKEYRVSFEQKSGKSFLEKDEILDIARVINCINNTHAENLSTNKAKVLDYLRCEIKYLFQNGVALEESDYPLAFREELIEMFGKNRK